MAKRMDVILVIDIESTCWEGHPPRGQASEIIEIGICPVKVKFTRTEKRSILVKPEWSDVSEFCTTLTTLTQKHRLPAETQFGRILPRVSTDAPGGRPEAAFRASRFKKDVALRSEQKPSAARIVAIGMEASRLRFEIAAASSAASIRPSEKFYRSTQFRSLEAAIAAAKGNFIFRMARPRSPVAVKPKTAKKAIRTAPPLGSLLAMREVEHWVQRLGDLLQLRAWQAGSSWQGRAVYAMEAALAGGGRLVSIARSRLLKPKTPW